MTSIDPTPTPVEERKKSKKRFLIWGSVLAIGALITAAAFTDAEWAFLTADPDLDGQVVPDPEDPGDGTIPTPPGDGEDGPSNPQMFNLQLSTSPTGPWGDYSKSAPLGVYLEGADGIGANESTEPGVYYVRNSADLDADTMFISMISTSNTSQTLLDELTFTVAIDGAELDGDTGDDDATFTYQELQNVDMETALESGGVAKVEVTLHVGDADPEVIGEGGAGLYLRIDGTSVEPTS